MTRSEAVRQLAAVLQAVADLPRDDAVFVRPHAFAETPAQVREREREMFAYALQREASGLHKVRAVEAELASTLKEWVKLDDVHTQNQAELGVARPIVQAKMKRRAELIDAGKKGVKARLRSLGFDHDRWDVIAAQYIDCERRPTPNGAATYVLQQLKYETRNLPSHSGLRAHFEKSEKFRRRLAAKRLLEP